MRKKNKPAYKKTKPTNAPDMPILMDNPDFQIVTNTNKIRVSIAAYRIKNKVQFNFDAVSYHLEVSTPARGMSMNKPMFNVYNVFSILSKKASTTIQSKVK